MSIELLLARQNRDGGWPYVRGASWTEPTVYAAMALLAAEETEAAQRALRWILGAQLGDGGWPPCNGVAQSTWVTALVALLPRDFLGRAAQGRAIEWLLGTTGEESTRGYRVRQWLRGSPRNPAQEFPGWPWITGTAAWVVPTSAALLALQRESRRRTEPEIQRRVADGRRFLLARMCAGGGWNHGSAWDIGYDSHPYPETTGIALAALRGDRSPGIERALAVAGAFLEECRSADALNWLRLGLLAHGRLPRGKPGSFPVVRRTMPEISLDLVIASAAHTGDLFWG